MSKQLLNDMGAPNLIQKDPYGNFINALVPVEEPAITNNLDGQAFEYEEYQLKAVETGMILLIGQLEALLFGSFSRIVNKRSLEFLFTNLKVAY